MEEVSLTPSPDFLAVWMAMIANKTAEELAEFIAIQEFACVAWRFAAHSEGSAKVSAMKRGRALNMRAAELAK